MQFVNGLIKGFGWGIGLGLGFLISSIGYQLYQDSRAEGFANRIEEAFPQDVVVADIDVQKLKASVLKNAVMGGTILVAGEVSNVLSRPLKFASVQAAVIYDEIVIEKCHGATSEVILPGKRAPISVICQKDWSSLDADEIEIQLTVSNASYNDV